MLINCVDHIDISDIPTLHGFAKVHTSESATKYEKDIEEEEMRVVIY